MKVLGSVLSSTKMEDKEGQKEGKSKDHRQVTSPRPQQRVHGGIFDAPWC